MPKKSEITRKPSLPGYNFGQADETLTKGAATAGGLKKEKPVSATAVSLKKEESAAATASDSKKEESAMEMSAFNFNPGLREAAKDGKLDNNPQFKAAVENSGYQMKYEMVNKEGFQMAGNPTKIAAFQRTGKTTKETAKSEEVKKKTVPGEEITVTSKEKSKGSYKNVYDTFKTNDKGQKINPRNKKVYNDLSEFVADAKANPAKEKTTVTKTPDKVVETVTKDPVYADKTMFNIDEQRERGQQSLLASRQSNREGLNKLVAQKAGLKTALKSNIDKVRNQEFDSRKDRREEIRDARKLKRGAMKSFRSGNFTGLKDRVVDAGVTDLRGFDAGASTLARRQAQGIDKSVRYYDTQSALDKGVRAGGTYSDVARTSQAGADYTAEITPSSKTNMLDRGETGGSGFRSSNFSVPTLDYKKNININSFSGNNMKKANYMKPMQLSSKAMNYFNKKNKK